MSDSSIPSPCFVIEESLLKHNLERIARLRDRTGIKVLCALKAFSNYHTFPLINQYLDGYTASSLNEAKLSFVEGKNKPHLCLPVYLDKEFDELVAMTDHITFNSLTQFQRFRNRVGEANVALRINPEYSEVETEIYNPCATDSRLGIKKSELSDHLPEGVSGLHFHMHCEDDSFTFERSLNHIVEHFKDYLETVQWVNFGGGHLITKKGYDVDHFVQVINTFKSRFPHLEIIIEPGSAIAWETGYLQTTVEDVLKKDDVTILMLDVSISNHMPDCLEMPYQPAVRGAKVHATGDRYRLGGMTCLAGDFIGDYQFEGKVNVGDSLILEDMIHYTTVKTNTFNGVNLPSIGIIKQDGEFELLKSFGYEDFKSRL